MAIFQPSDVSGLFLWYRAHSIGIPTGSAVTYWQDDSGSGNDLTPFTSSNPIFPTYITNVLNGYPVVRFNGTTNYLYKANNASLNLSPSSLTLFTVYKTNNDSTEQIVCANDNVGGVGSKNSFIIGINNIYPSGWYFARGKDAGLGLNFLYASSIHEGFRFSPGSQFVLRSDGWNPASHNFSFGLYGAEVATGIQSMSVSTSNTFKVGYGDFSSLYFNGDIAEIVGYNRMVTSGEYFSIAQYLLFKYALPTIKYFPLFIYGADSSVSSIYNSFPLYTTGVGSYNNSLTLYEGGYSSENSTTTFYIGSSTNISGNINLYTSASTPINSSLSLYMISIGSSNLPTTLYIGSSESINSGITLWMTGSPIGSYYTSTTLYTASTTIYNSGINLYTSGAYLISSGLTLFTPGGYETSNFPLYMNGFSSGNLSTTLYIANTVSINSGSTLYIEGIYSGASQMPIFLYNKPPATGTKSLQFFLANSLEAGSSASGIYKTIPMYMGGGFGPSAEVSLYLQSLVESSPSSTMPLFLKVTETSGSPNDNFTLFLMNEISGYNSPRLKMYVKGDGVMDGASIGNASMPLYINRPNDNGFNMYIWGHDTSTSGISMFITSANSINSGVSLYIEGIGQTGSFNLFLRGGQSINSGINMYIKGTPEINNNAILYTHGF